MKINKLINLQLNIPIEVTITPDEDGFIAKTSRLPLYGYGDNQDEALDALKVDIELLYSELNEDDNFTEEWIDIREYLFQIINGCG